MRQLLGSLMITLLFPIFLWGGVKATVDKNALYRGDSVTYTISVTGSDVEFPTITEIGGYAIEGTAGSQNISIVNGNFEKTVAKSYTFVPYNSLEIPSYKVLVNGGVEMTNPIEVKIVEPSQDKTAPIVLDINLSKNKVHVGEMVRFNLIFKKKPNVPVYKLDIEEPKFEDFWVKKVDGVKEGVDGEYTTQTYTYLLFAQKSGELKIPAITANIGQLSRQNRRGIDPFFNSSFGQQVRYTKVFSNELSLDVEPLPNGLELYGDFDIKVEVDKRSVLANKPLNLTISVDGLGNIDDVQKFELDIPGVVTYANEPVIKSGIKDDIYFGHFEQKIVIIADGSYTIPPFTIRYFDQNSQQERVKESEPIAITVTGGVAKVSKMHTTPLEGEAAPSKEERTASVQSIQERDWVELLMAAGVGFGLGAFLVWLMMRSSEGKDSNEPIVVPMEKRIKKAKSDKALFELLLPYKNESKIIDESLVQLEENLYKGGKHTVDTKALIAYFSGEDEKVELL